MRKLLPLALFATMMTGCVNYPYVGTSFEAAPRIPSKVEVPDEEHKVSEPGSEEEGSKPEAGFAGSTEETASVVPSGEIGRTPSVFPVSAQPTGRAPVSNKMTTDKVGD